MLSGCLRPPALSPGVGVGWATRAPSIVSGVGWGTRQGVVPPPCTTRVSSAVVTPGWNADAQDPYLKLHVMAAPRVRVRPLLSPAGLPQRLALDSTRSGVCFATEDSLRSKFNSLGRREVWTEVSERNQLGGEGMAPWAVGSEAEARPGQTGSVPTRTVIALQTPADTLSGGQAPTRHPCSSSGLS